MTLQAIEKRLSALEREVREGKQASRRADWWLNRTSPFKGDDVYLEITRLGRAY